MLVVIFETLSFGSCMHWEMPSNNHPSNSFHVAQSPSPCCSFLMEMGLLVGSSWGLGGRKMLRMLCRTAQVKCCSLAAVGT